VVQEERRRSVDNQPYGRLYETLQENAYTNFAYKHPTIGSLADLDAANLGDVARFYKTYYAPNNAVISVVGDFDGRETRAWIAEHFGPIPRGPEPEFPSLAEPPQSEERRVTLKDPLAPLPAYVAGYKVPPGNGPDFAALDVLATVLTGGKTSRLGKLLVEERQLATSVDADVDPGRGPGLFTIEMDFGPGQSVDAAEAALDAEIARIREKGVTPEEVRRAQRLRRRDVLAARRSAQERAIALGANAVMFDDPNRVNTYPDAFQRVTPADVRRVAARYLSPSNRTVVIDVPAPETAPETAAPETGKTGEGEAS
jgi:predicted Zn-dependent peptidase